MSTTILTHIEIQASELRPGDGLQLGWRTGYVLISSVEQDRDDVLVTVYHGSDPGSGPEYSYDRNDLVRLSARDRKPCQGCDAILSDPGPNQCPRCDE